MSLTKKHFKAIAEIIAKIDDGEIRKFLIDEFSVFCRAENGLFDKCRFESYINEKAKQELTA
jgi:hypothetical protein